MKLNKKGMTLVELIISIALLSVVIGFLYKIVLDVKYEADDAGFAIKNQANRAEIIKLIQNDFIEHNVQYVNLYSSPESIIFDFATKRSEFLKVSEDGKKLEYGAKVWSIKDDFYYYGNIKLDLIEDSNYFKVTIPVIDSNNENNSSVDDIILFGKLK